MSSVCLQETHIEFAVFFAWCAGKSDNNILRKFLVYLVFCFYRKGNSFLTVYKNYQSLGLQAHSQLDPFSAREGVFPWKVNAGEISSLSQVF